MLESALPIIGRRYQLIEQLGSGGMGSVYRAYDRLSGQSVALKQVLTESDEAIASSGIDGVDLRLSLANEFRMMASLRHPHVISVLDYGFDDNHLPYYTMDLLDDAQSVLEAAATHTREGKINLLAQILQALAYTHRRGIIHRDMKPTNVLVSQGSVKVLDFGLSIVRGQQESSVESTVGTLAYMAPEVLTGAPATEAADLYAVGIMAYEMFTGRHPFGEENVVTLLKSVLYAPPDFTNTNLDARLILLLERALSKNPEDRFATAEEMLAALSDIIDGGTLTLETEEIRDSFLQAARLVGRDRELGQLSDAFEASLQGKGSAWLVGGESGVGKSRLLDEIATMAMVKGAVVLRGQAIDQGSTPYQLWRPTLRWLCLLSEPDDSEMAIIEQYAPGVSSLVQRTIPNTENAPRNSRNRLPQVFETLLRRQKRPIVIILEDLQWAGSEGTALLAHLSKIVSGLPLLIIGSYRDDERPDLPANFPEMHTLRLTRLAERDIAELSEAMLGPRGRDEQVVDLLQRETEGNVYFLIEVVRALAEEAGRLDQIGVMTLPPQVFAGGMQRIIARRLDCVLSNHRPLLRVAAVIGREFDVNLLKVIAPQIDLESWLNNCANAAVIEMQDGQWRFAHDKLRQAVLEQLSGDERKAIHRQVATAIEAMYEGNSLEDQSAALSYHWAEAGDHQREGHYAMLAGDLALRNGANQEALDFLSRALLLLEAASAVGIADKETVPQTTIWLKQRIAEAHAALGRYQEAQQTYQAALTLARTFSDRGIIAELLMNLGDVAYVMEAFEQAEKHYEDSLALYEAVGDMNGVVRALNNLGNVAYDLDDYTKANQFYQRSLALSREIGNQWGMAGSFAASDTSGDDL